MFVEEAKALSGHATLVASQVEGRLQVVDVEDDLIVTNGQRVNVVEVGEEEPDFGGVVPDGPLGVPTGVEGSRKFEEQMLRFRIERRCL